MSAHLAQSGDVHRFFVFIPAAGVGAHHVFERGDRLHVLGGPPLEEGASFCIDDPSQRRAQAPPPEPWTTMSQASGASGRAPAARAGSIVSKSQRVPCISSSLAAAASAAVSAPAPAKRADRAG